MYEQLSTEYRKCGHSLYQRQGDAFVHVAIVPHKYRSLEQAAAWFESQD